ncbi:MAG: tetratricopeptide repeat protein [Bacteroidota bacterium]|nr:tetratricopeptide repeat protein [Bacteroidota bacterium]
MTRRLLVMFFGLMSFMMPILSLAQATQVFQPVRQVSAMADELYQNEKYGSARVQYEQIAQDSRQSLQIRDEARLFSALCAARLQNADAIETILKYISLHPESTALNAAYFELGRLQFNNNAYSEALQSFDKVETIDFTNEKLAEYLFKTGYCKFVAKKIDAAEKDFAQVRNTSSPYAIPSTYYYSHIAYTKGRYNEALEGFTKLQKDPAYGKLVPYYMAQIYYLQGKYDELLALTLPILNGNNNRVSSEMVRLTGNAYFHKGQYSDAIPLLERFAENNSSALNRNDYYQLGYACYQTANYARGIKWFQEVTKVQDSLSQNAWYHLADCYLKTNQKKFAGEAFQTASKMPFNKDLAEEALFNYARISIETNFSPYNDAIKALRDYINGNPNSNRMDEANNLLAQLLLITKNYKTALEVMESIKNKDSKLKATYQKIAYYRGVELYNDRDFKGAITLFEKSAQYSADRSITAQSLYLTAESWYQLANWNQAADYYNKFSSAPGASQSPGYLYANYNLGYCYYKQQNYSQANAYFRKFLSDRRIHDNRSLSDAYIRSADCFLMEKNYNEAIQNYDQALQLRAASPEYAYLQKAMALGAKGDLRQKVDNLNQIIEKYPQSSYSDKVRFEIANAYLLLKDDANALRYFDDVINKYPNSPMAVKAMLKEGLIQYNNDRNDLALDRLKKLITKYPGTQEAREAMSTVKNIYVDMNRVSEYMDYASRLQQGNINTSEQDSLLYVAAENQYMKGNCDEAIKGFSDYQQQFPNGSFSLKAAWYKADCETKSGKNNEALEDFKRIIDLPPSEYTVKALQAVSGMLYQQKQYTEALVIYTKLENSATDRAIRAEALAGQMRCNYKLNNWGLAAQAAQRLQSGPDLTIAQLAESNLVLGTSSLKLDNLSLARKSLEKAMTDHGAIGAEATYSMAAVELQQKRYKEAEKLVMTLQNSYASYDYWVAKGFILLADVYTQSSNLFQAQQTLQSIIDNYKGDDEIIGVAKEKLASVEAAKSTTK